MKLKIPYRDSLKNGRMEFLWPNGAYRGFAYFKDDYHDKISRAWHPNGIPCAIARFENMLQNGIGTQYYPNGKS